MRAILSNTRAEALTDGGQVIASDVMFYGNDVTNGPLPTVITVPFNDNDTLNQIGAKVLAGVDAEAARLSLAAPTRVIGPTFTKYR